MQTKHTLRPLHTLHTWHSLTRRGRFRKASLPHTLSYTMHEHANTDGLWHTRACKHHMIYMSESSETSNNLMLAWRDTCGAGRTI